MTTIPTHRLPLVDVAGRQYGALFRLSNSVELDESLRHLIEVRASQINGCAFCLDMHWLDAMAAGERPDRLYLLDAWREAPAALYDGRERAALALCEAVTLVSQDGVPDAVWEAASAAFSDEELGQLLFAIATINVWNRLNVAIGTEPGHYEPGMFSQAA